MTRTGRDPGDVIDPGTRQVRVCVRRCGTCLFRPQGREVFGADRAAEVIQGNLDADALLTCHMTLPYGANPDFGPAVCAGFWARHRRDVIAGRLAIMIGVTRVTPPGGGHG